MHDDQKIYLLRHGHSEWQTAYEATGIDPGIVDSPLSETGKGQVSRLPEQLAALENLDSIVTSPLTRAIKTAIGARANDGSVPIVVNPLLRERLGDSCDIGRPASTLKTEYPNLNFSDMPEQWWHAGPEDDRGIPLEPYELLDERAAQFKDWLRLRDERFILAVSHNDFLRTLCGLSLPNCEIHEWDRSV